MIGNITSGKDFRGCLSYVFGVDKGAEIVGGNMPGENPKALAEEFERVRSLKNNISKPVWHISLSSVVGETLTWKQWNMIAEDYLLGMGLDINIYQYIAVRHKDRNHDHIHLIVNRIGANGKVFDRKNDRYNSKKLMREIERIYELTPVRGKSKMQENVQERARSQMRTKKQERRRNR